MIPYSTLPPSWLRRLGLALILPSVLVSAMPVASFAKATANPAPTSRKAQTPADGRSLTLRADVQEANYQTGVITARGNVQISYPARQIQATAAQAQYFSRERRIVLNGNVYVLQQGNSIRGETVTYLIDEGRFVALPKSDRQVESIYIVSDPNPLSQPLTAPATPPLNAKPASQTPSSEPSP